MIVHVSLFIQTLHNIVDPYPPPSNIHLAEINSTHLTFHWSPISSNCDAIQYRIMRSNCGLCPNVTNSTSVTCYINGLFTNSSRQLYLCTFTVQTVVCANIVGNESKRIQGNLRSKLSNWCLLMLLFEHYL